MKLSINTGSPERFALLKACGFDACDFSLGDYLERDGSLGDMKKLTDGQLEEVFCDIRN